MSVRRVALLYARVSVIQDGHETSPAVQLERCLRLALERGRTVVADRDIYSDTAPGQHSAFTRENMPQWQKLEARALTDPEVADVIVDGVDRAYRNVRELLNFEAQTKALGIKLVFVDSGEVETDSPTGMLQFAMKGLLAEMHARDTSYRIKTRHYDALRARGLYLGHRAPPGLKRVGSRFDVRLEAGPKLPLIVEFLKLYLQDNGTPAAAKALEKRGLIPRGHWSRWRTAFKKVLGHLAAGWYDGIIDPLLLSSVKVEYRRRAREERRSRRPRDHAVPALWQLLVCAECGRRYTLGVGHVTYGRKTYVNFRHQPQGDCTGVLHLSALKADKQVLAWLSCLSNIPEDVKSGAAEAMFAPMSTDAPDAELQISKLEARLRGYEQMRADGDIPRDRFRELKAELESQIGELRQQQRVTLAGPRWTREGARLFLDGLFSTNFANALERDPESVNRLLRVLCRRVVVERGERKGKPTLRFELQPDFVWLEPTTRVPS